MNINSEKKDFIRGRDTVPAVYTKEIISQTHIQEGNNRMVQNHYYHQKEIMSTSEALLPLIRQLQESFLELNRQLQEFNRQINGQLQEINEQLQEIKGALLPNHPCLLKFLETMELVAPRLTAQQCPPSTWTIAEVGGNRCIIGSKHCAINYCMYTSGKHLCFVELNSNILRRKVKKVRLVNPQRGNLTTQDLASDDIIIIDVENTTTTDGAYVPILPPPIDLDTLSQFPNRDLCCIGRSQVVDVSSFYGASFHQEDNCDRKGLIRFVMNRCEKGNSGTIMHVYDKLRNQYHAFGVLRGLDTAHEGNGRTHMAARGLAVICPPLDKFQEFEVLSGADPIYIPHIRDRHFDAIVGFNHDKKQLAQGKLTFKCSDYDRNIFTMQDVMNNKIATGVLFVSDFPIPYSARAQMDFDPYTFALG